jgi:ribose transport system substrate-binding protein
MSKKILILGFVVLLFVLFGVSVIGSAEDFKVGINNFGQANFFARIGRESLMDEVKILGGTPIATVTASVPERINAIENYISQGVDAIIIQEGDIKMAAPALEEAKKQGIIIVSKGKVVEIFNDLGQMIRMRRKELQAVITEYTGVEIAAGFTYAWPDFFPDAKSKMEAVLQAQPDIVGVFATFDGVGVAAAQAIREAGLQDQISVVGIDGDPQAYEEMRQPGSPFKATVAQDPDTMARTAVRMTFKLLNGEEIPRSHVYIPARLVVIENLPEPGKRFPDEK